MTAAIHRPRSFTIPADAGLPGLFFLVVASVVSAGALVVLGLWALVFPLYGAFVVAAVLFPYRTVLVLLCLCITFEPPSFDFTRLAGQLLYDLPPGVRDAVWLTISPIEIVIVLASASVLIRRQGSSPPFGLPVVVWLVPVAVTLGVAYGMFKGAETALVYHESRAMIYGSAIFILASRVRLEQLTVAVPAVLLSTFVLAVLSLVRYFQYLREGTAGIPIEAAYAHETPAILTIGMVLAVGLAFRTPVRRGRRLLLLVYLVLLACALIATGRRAGTLVLLTAALTLAVMLFRHRPVLVILAVLVGAVLMAGYLAVYWNKEYGAAAQPARAIRSQFDPSSRDESSDQYRVVERQNVVETIRLNRAFGVGFGRPFSQFRPLPDLTSFWPLQSYVPHQNVLWLWLKLGFFGTTTVLTMTVLALRRALWSARGLDPGDPRWILALLLGATILMYLAFATVDIAFASTRAIAPMAAALGLAFRLPPYAGERK